MMVTNRKNYAPEATCFKSQEKVFPTSGALPVGHFHSENLAPAFPINADGYEYRL